MEEVEVADQSLQTSVHSPDDVMNVSMKAMTLEDDMANISMEDLAKADTLDVCDVSSLQIQSVQRPCDSAIKLFLSWAPGHIYPMVDKF